MRTRAESAAAMRAECRRSSPLSMRQDAAGARYGPQSTLKPNGDSAQFQLPSVRVCLWHPRPLCLCAKAALDATAMITNAGAAILILALQCRFDRFIGPGAVEAKTAHHTCIAYTAPAARVHAACRRRERQARNAPHSAQEPS